MAGMEYKMKKKNKQNNHYSNRKTLYFEYISQHKNKGQDIDTQLVKTYMYM